MHNQQKQAIIRRIITKKRGISPQIPAVFLIIGIAILRYRWMVRYKKNSIKPSTYDRLLTSFNLMKDYSIAYVYLDALCGDDIQEYINKLVKDGYALTTVKKQFNLLTGYLRYANANGIIAKPIYNSVKLPSASSVLKPRKEICAYDDRQQILLKRVLKTHSKVSYDVVLFMLESGVRIGEALALNWSDVNWSRKSIRINKTFVRLGNGKRQFIQDTAKSFTSNRVIPLSTDAFALLKNLYEREANLEDADGLILHNEDGSTMTYETMRYQIKLACSEARVPYLGQHVFRHTFATNCYNRGCDVKIMSKLLGHSDVTITYNIYIHLFGDALEEMRKVLG